jgi:2-methylisocitrate lyase-like PEP mutase family enzyme
MTDRDEQRRKAGIFSRLHAAPKILVLPCAWDTCSARLFEVEGFKAVGTTSAGIAATLGYPDGQQMSVDEAVDAFARIVRHVGVPVSADIEAGYAASTEGVVETARRVMDAGAAGLNLEDGTGDPSAPLCEVSRQVERITAIREMADSAGVPLVVNARIDVYLVSRDRPDIRLRQTVERAGAYRKAGADCIFVPTPLDEPGLLDRNTIIRLVDEIAAPLNVLGGSVTLPIPELEELGVARVSLGPGPMRAALALIRRIAREIMSSGTYECIMRETIPYSEVNAWFGSR